MADIIQLLPDNVANQIAAGEVIQRPASVVKELLENAVDAGSTQVKLIIKDGGRTLIQVIDNGCGMSDTDARLSFERHATSKVRSADDLFALRTKGFRGEALASMAAIAHVELKTKQIGEELGTKIEVEGSVVNHQEATNCPAGSSFSVKNLFYNVPARRNFLKSDQIETRHIMDEFQRLALSHCDIEWVFIHNGNEIFHLPPGTLRQRLVGLFNKKMNEKLVPIDEETSIVGVKGFIGKPEYAKKVRGEQFFFVNNRFIKSAYLNNAVTNAYADLIQTKNHPTYFIFLELDPSTIDINIHPTKTEIKFEDDKSIYAILNSGVKQSLGKYNIAPTLDFETETCFNVPHLEKGQAIQVPQIHVDPTFNPFKADDEEDSPIEASRFSAGAANFSGGESNSFSTGKFNPTGGASFTGGTSAKPMASSADFEKVNASFQPDNSWESFYNFDDIEEKDEEALQTTLDESWKSNGEIPEIKNPVQYHGRYISVQIKSGILLIHQSRAHERVLFEQFVKNMAFNQVNTQRLLFPEKLDLSATDRLIFEDVLNDLKLIGFDFELSEKNIAILGVPTEVMDNDPQQLIEEILEKFKQEEQNIELNQRELLARSMAKNLAIKAGKYLSTQEITALVEALFESEIPYYTPAGKPTMITFTLEDLLKRFDT